MSTRWECPLHTVRQPCVQRMLNCAHLSCGNMRRLALEMESGLAWALGLVLVSVLVSDLEWALEWGLA